MVAPRRDVVKRWRALKQSVPFLLFALQSLLATYYSLHPTLSGHAKLKLVFRYLLAWNMLLAGVMHFVPSSFAFYESMVFLPFAAFWVYASGLVFAAAALALCFDATQVLAAKVLAGAFVAVFPANLACVVMRKPREKVFGGSRLAAVLRLPFQAAFVAWAMWFAKPTVAA